MNYENSTIDGLCPIFQLREIFNIKLLRPFLNISKEQILKFNLYKNINFTNDISNTNKYYRSTRKLLNKNQKLKKFNKSTLLFCKN